MTPEEILGTSSTEIDGHKYETQMLGGISAWKLMLRITKVLGPSLGKVVDVVFAAAKGKAGTMKARDVMAMLMSMDLSSSFVNEMTEALVDRMEEAELEYIIMVLATQCAADGKVMDPMHFDAHWRGRPWAMLKWLVWAMQVQYSGFGSDSTTAAERVVASGSGNLAAAARA